MLGWSLFRHSCLMVIRNGYAGLQIVFLPALIMAAVIFFSFSSVNAAINSPGSQGVNAAAFGSAILFFLVALVLWLGIAVNWHRHILLNQPTSWIMSPFPVRPSLKYGVTGFGIGLLLVVPGIVLGFVMSSVLSIFVPDLFSTAPSGSPSQESMVRPTVISFLVGLPVLVLLYFFFLKFSAALAAAAIGSDLRTFEAFSAVKMGIGTCVVLILLLSGLSLLGDLLMVALPPGTVTTTLIALGLEFFYIFLHISVITTIYGHFIEGRDLS